MIAFCSQPSSIAAEHFVGNSLAIIFFLHEKLCVDLTIVLLYDCWVIDYFHLANQLRSERRLEAVFELFSQSRGHIRNHFSEGFLISKLRENCEFRAVASNLDQNISLWTVIHVL